MKFTISDNKFTNNFYFLFYACKKICRRINSMNYEYCCFERCFGNDIKTLIFLWKGVEFHFSRFHKGFETSDFGCGRDSFEKESVVNKPQKFSGATPTVSWSDTARDAPSGRCVSDCHPKRLQRRRNHLSRTMDR